MLTTIGGFPAIFQKQLAAHVNVPEASSSLMQIPLVQSTLPPDKRVGVSIFTVYTFVRWFQARLQPRYCGRPSAPSVSG